MDRQKGEDSDEEQVRRVTWEQLQADPEPYLAEYTKRFANVLNAMPTMRLRCSRNTIRTRCNIA
jgi:hypothetical protein